MESPSEGTVGNSNGRLRANSGRRPRGKVTILRKKSARRVARRPRGRARAQSHPGDHASAFGLGKLGFEIGDLLLPAS